ncbi:ABC transporter substrate-binding protein [Halovivax cerinus]|uniref:ABC transporter substrate-binding protein n=1 Tax=Halovivax cerinus TaxID=1487865 RepID=A0ABD5NLC1_9EURY|nr:ABC transporter substrate-binding protein [Halovivax cerinus]
MTRRQLVASGAAVTGMLVAGCLTDDDQDEPDDYTVEGNGLDSIVEPDDPDRTMSLRITQQVEPEHNYDPIVTNDVYTQRIVSHIYDGLYEYDERLELRPKLADGQPETERDGKRFVVSLTDGATFSNGDPVTAEDVVYSFTAPVEEQTDNLTEYNMIDSAEAVDDRTVQLDLGDDPYGPFTTVTLGVNVVNKSVRESDKDAYNTENPVGSGPYAYVDHVNGDYVDIELRDDYWDADTVNAYIDDARFVATEDDASRVAQIRGGDTDVIMGVPPDDIPGLAREDGITVAADASISYFYAAFNCNEGPTTDPDVRRGIAKAFSMSRFVEQTVEPAGTSISSPIPDVVATEWDFPVDEWADAEADVDREGAADLLSDHDGWEPRIIVPPDDIREALGSLIARRLQELDGVDINPSVQRLDWAPFNEQAMTGNADDYAIYTLGWAGAPDPDTFVYPLFHESGEGATQGHYYGDDDFHSKIERARASADVDERRDLYTGVIDEIIGESVVLPAYSMTNSYAYGDSVTNLTVHPSSGLNPRLASDYAGVFVDGE